MVERLFKALNEDGSCHNGGVGRWSLPVQHEDGTWTPGEWMPAIVGDLELCANGYHLCRMGDLLGWLAPAIYEAEYRGERIDGTDKIVVREARLTRRPNWDDRSARLFACDCAERVLPLFEQTRPHDSRPRAAIETARRYVNGQAADAELAAAGAAARDAAGAAARAAAGAAAGDAAWNAAGAAAWNAAWAAARDAECVWQTQRLIAYLDGEVG